VQKNRCKKQVREGHHSVLISVTLEYVPLSLDTASKAMGTLEDLPEECVLGIACGLAVRDLLALACTCRRFARLVQVQSLPRRMGQDAWFVFRAHG